jgi:RNA polymerase sigma factor (sigma-70 family)
MVCSEQAWAERVGKECELAGIDICVTTSELDLQSQDDPRVFGNVTRQPAADADDLLALDDALEALTRLSPRQATMVESRFFGGFELSEIAELLDVSEATILRDWRAARAWLAAELRADR